MASNLEAEWVYNEKGGRTLLDADGNIILYEGPVIGSMDGIDWVLKDWDNELES